MYMRTARAQVVSMHAGMHPCTCQGGDDGLGDEGDEAVDGEMYCFFVAAVAVAVAVLTVSAYARACLHMAH